MHRANSSKMYSAFSLWLSSTIIFLFSFCTANSSTHIHEDFLQCVSIHFLNSTSSAKLIYTPNDTSYFSILDSTIQNPRFSSPSTPKPYVIVTPFHASQVQATVYCSKKHGIEIRIRSGGHDFEGVSYVSNVPFVILDLRNLRSIKIDIVKKTAWVQVGATLGEVYYWIAKKSGNLGFPAGVCPTVGVGGHFSGGGYGHLMRKYGLAADNIVEALLVNVDGKILDRKSMGKDLFWAIRGGGADSFGVVLAWKIRLVYVPSKVTVFTLVRNLELNETKKLVHRWQYVSPKFHEDLLLFVRIQTVNISTKDGNGKTILQASFISMFLGGVDRLLPLMRKSFPELGLVRKDCIEMRWIESLLYANGFAIGEPLEVLLDRAPQSRLVSYKGKSDYVKEPIPEKALEGLWEMLIKEEVGSTLLQFFPYGAKMNDITESKIPFPHRAGYLYKMVYMVAWVEAGMVTTSERYIGWSRRIYHYLTPYVSKNPRAAYLNYRDLDLGTNSKNGTTSYTQASIWGTKYFGDNFKKLVHVKSRVDPANFFKNEQSIPSLSSSRWMKSSDSST